MKTIRLSDGREYPGVLMVKRDAMNPRLWVGVHADPVGDGYVGTEGECSRQYYRTAKSATYALAKRFNVPRESIGIIRGYGWNDNAVQKAYDMQYGGKK